MYYGKLYGKLVGKYFELEMSTHDIKALKKENARLKRLLNKKNKPIKRNMITEAQIQKQIKGIEQQKLFLPPVSLFGVPNHKCFDMQVKILKQEVDFEDLKRDDFLEELDEVFLAGQRAYNWLNENYVGDLFGTDE